MNEIFGSMGGLIKSLFDWSILMVSMVLTLFLKAIGYPSQIVYLICFLIVCDVLTRWYAEVKKKYGYFNMANFIKSWGEEKVLTSKKLKSGVFAKIFIYSIILILANMSIINHQLFFGLGEKVGYFLYSCIVSLDTISILENFVNAGYSKFKPILKGLKNLFNKKKNEFLETDSKND